MTSALDKKGNRILGSEAGERVVNQVIKGKKPFFSTNVSLDGTRNYGYFIPVYQNGTTDQVIGMVFVGTNKARKDAIVNKILGSYYDGIACSDAFVHCYGDAHGSLYQ